MFEKISGYTSSHPLEKEYRTDEIIKDHGHIPLRLPPYLCELNPIELVWADVKRCVRKHTTTGELSIADL